MRYYMGVDPGNKGAIAIINSKRQVVHTLIMPTFKTKFGSKSGKMKTFSDNISISNNLQEWANSVQKDEQYIEKIVIGFEILHVTPRSHAYGAFNMGVSYGLLWGALEGVHHSCNGIIKQFKSGEWRSGIIKAYMPYLRKNNLITPKMDPKQISIALAVSLWGKEVLFPSKRHSSPHDGIAEALLMAECMRLLDKKGVV